MKQLLAVLFALAFAGAALAQGQPAPASAAPKAEGKAASHTPHKKSGKKRSTKAKPKAPAAEEKKS